MNKSRRKEVFLKRRIDAEPTKEMIDRVLTDDVAGRKAELRKFVELIDSIEGNFSIFLDGEWGSGKTFFVKETERILDLVNQNTVVKVSDGDKKGLCAGIVCDEMNNSHLPIYFNAWEYDYYDNPIVPLMETVISEFRDLAGLEKEGKPIRENIVGLLKALKLNFGCSGLGIEVDFEKAIEAFENNNFLDEFNGKREIRNRLKDLLDVAKEGRANRIVLFVDELDRCRPEYAVRTLEALKFLFDQDYLTMVFSVNAKALGSAVSHWYGSGFDGARYLMRFYDVKVGLGNCDAHSYLGSLGLSFDSMNDFVLRCAQRTDVTMRDANRWLESIKAIAESAAYKDSLCSMVESFCMRVLVPAAVIYSTIHPEKRDSLFAGRESDSFRDWLFEDTMYVEEILDMPSEWFGSANDETLLTSVEMDRDYEAASRFEEFYDLIFSDEDPRTRTFGDTRVFHIRRTARTALGVKTA